MYTRVIWHSTLDLNLDLNRECASATPEGHVNGVAHGHVPPKSRPHNSSTHLPYPRALSFEDFPNTYESLSSTPGHAVVIRCRYFKSKLYFTRETPPTPLGKVEDAILQARQSEEPAASGPNPKLPAGPHVDRLLLHLPRCLLYPGPRYHHRGACMS